MLACWSSLGDGVGAALCLARRASQYNVILLDTSRRSAALMLFLPRRRLVDFAEEPVREAFIRASSNAMLASKRFFSL